MKQCKSLNHLHVLFFGAGRLLGEAIWRRSNRQRKWLKQLFKQQVDEQNRVNTVDGLSCREAQVSRSRIHFPCGLGYSREDD